MLLLRLLVEGGGLWGFLSDWKWGREGSRRQDSSPRWAAFGRRCHRGKSKKEQGWREAGLREAASCGRSR